jgi:hypothetical protein
MSEATEHYEYGYRTEDTGDVWAVDHGDDGTWVPKRAGRGTTLIRTIDLYDGEEISAIRSELARARVRGVVLRRKVTTTYGEPEVVPE